MPSTDRLTSAARDQGKTLINAGTDRLTSAVRGRKKSLLYAGAALALAGAGTATAATVAESASAPASAAGAEAGVLHATAPAAAAAQHAARHGVAAHRPVAPAHRDPKHTAVRHDATPKARHDATPKAAVRHDAAPQAVPSHPAASHAAPRVVARRAGTHRHGTDRPAVTWQRVSSKLNRETNPVAAAHHQMPPADQLMPVGTTGPQTWMPLNQAQVANASTIVKQALVNKMGVRSAVIAVATAMQESGLVNVNYGTGNSLGLFQQQWNMGWGTAAQIMNPRFAANAFLTALRQYQASNPSWAAQPLWQAAQGVQKSAFPYAYAKWEAQAASLVKQIATHVGSVTQ
ncbi:MAG: hypothetical protein ACLQFR_23375 [Streptosporangiaceae bacterium]